jgi:hypothetical protein
MCKYLSYWFRGNFFFFWTNSWTLHWILALDPLLAFNSYLGFFCAIYFFPRRVFLAKQWSPKIFSKFLENGCSTGTSREVTHPSTIPAQRRLTSEF